MELYLDGKLDEVYILFHQYGQLLPDWNQPSYKLLPLDPDVFPEL